ncbi:DUF3597 domain-containing protein [Paraurantiacibacter namhicola]|uniref:DUF3597 domain-containing protein n=1 Tax=Paraurantiacibacter namhicola TaxID=645517 RepID=A0A1C7D7M7_9SPHN|nr:DUF3597 domain-containing protein [Paraurantiacibacter namhicola]ANU07489.1 hypothetical protein A6F65_01182 [Paraurantiacibacter namhicola]
MGIFSSIKDAIFGKEAKAQDTAPNPSPTPSVDPRTGRAINQDGSVRAVQNVDVETKLSGMDGADKLNWRTSIVDLMKLVGIDSSYENRKELAQELGRTDYSGSAEDNIWLHKATMQEIAKNGGRVPASMTD